MDSDPVLLVDDSSTARKLRQIPILERTPHQVRTTKNGAEAVEAVVRTIPDLIIVDGALIHRTTSCEACQVLPSWNATKRIPLILLTPQRLQESVKNGHESGCNDDLTEPVDPAELVALLESYIGTCYKVHKETQHRDA